MNKINNILKIIEVKKEIDNITTDDLTTDSTTEATTEATVEATYEEKIRMLFTQRIEYERMGGYIHTEHGVSNKLNWIHIAQYSNNIDIIVDRMKYQDSLCNELKSKIAHEDKILWQALSQNPHAIDIIRERVKIEYGLSKDDYKLVTDKINWSSISNNPNAIDIIRERVEYEKKWSKEEYEQLNACWKLNWDHLNRRKDTIDILIENPDKIMWRNFNLYHII